MLDTVDTALDEIEQAVESARAIESPADALAFLKAVYQSRSVPLAVRMKAAIEALPFGRPSLRATAAGRAATSPACRSKEPTPPPSDSSFCATSSPGFAGWRLWAMSAIQAAYWKWKRHEQRPARSVLR